jgi:phage terminase small subunit
MLSFMSTLDELDAEALAQTCNDKERAFVREYVIDLNGRQAVLRAGCFNVNSENAADMTASRLLGRDKVKALIDVLTAQRISRTNITADSVLHEMSLLANSDQSHYLVDDNGQIQLAAGAPEGAMRAIQSVKRRKTIREDKQGTVTITHDVEIKLWDKPGSLKLMGRHVSLFPDKVQVTGKDGGPIETVTRIERVIVDALKS